MFCWRPSIGCWFSGGQAEDAGSAGGQAEAAGFAGGQAEAAGSAEGQTEDAGSAGGQAEAAGSAGGQAEAAGTAGKALGHAVEAALEGPGTAGQDSHCTLHRWIEGRLASMVCGTCGN